MEQPKNLEVVLQPDVAELTKEEIAQVAGGKKKPRRTLRRGGNAPWGQ